MSLSIVEIATSTEGTAIEFPATVLAVVGLRAVGLLPFLRHLACLILLLLRLVIGIVLSYVQRLSP